MVVSNRRARIVAMKYEWDEKKKKDVSMRNRLIIDLRLSMELPGIWTLQRIADEFNLTAEGIRLIVKRAIDRKIVLPVKLSTSAKRRKVV